MIPLVCFAVKSNCRLTARRVFQRRKTSMPVMNTMARVISQYVLSRQSLSTDTVGSLAILTGWLASSPDTGFALLAPFGAASCWTGGALAFGELSLSGLDLPLSLLPPRAELSVACRGNDGAVCTMAKNTVSINILTAARLYHISRLRRAHSVGSIPNLCASWMSTTTFCRPFECLFEYNSHFLTSFE